MTTQISDYLLWHKQIHRVEAGLSLKEAFPDVVFPKFDFISTACWRGYIATWEIDREGRLTISYLSFDVDNEDITQGYANKISEGNPIEEIFPNAKLPVMVNHYSGEIMAGYGQDIRSFGMYARSYPHYRVFHFTDGLLKQVDEHDRAWWEKDRVPYELPDFLRK